MDQHLKEVYQSKGAGRSTFLPVIPFKGEGCERAFQNIESKP
jgi:hypothetical protein